MTTTLEQEECENCAFEKLEWAAQNLPKLPQVFQSCQFNRCHLQATPFLKRRFISCHFIDCILSNTLLTECRLQNVRFENCKIIGVDFTLCSPFLFSVSFHKCVVQLCNFSSLQLKGAHFINCTLRETDFSEAHLQEADFSGSDLQGSLFHKTDLKKADFTDAKNYLINPFNNKLQKAKFSLPQVMSLLSFFDIEIK